MDAITARSAELGMERRGYLQRLYEDPVFFAQEIWHSLNLNRYGRLGVYERRMIRWFLGAMRGKKRVLIGPRGIGKTYFLTAVGICWYLFRDPESKHLLVSKSIGHTKETIFLLQSWIANVPFLKHLDASSSPTKRWKADAFDVATCADSRIESVKGLGIEGQLPGNRAYVVWADDVETDQNAQTIEARETLWRQTAEFDAIASWGDCEVAVVGTPWHETESAYWKLSQLRRLEGNEPIYHVRTVPVAYPSRKERQGIVGLDPRIIHDMRTRRVNVGDPVFPERFPRVIIHERLARGRTYFLMQYMGVLRMGDSMRYPLHLRDLIVFDVQRDKAPINIAWGTTDHHGQTTRIADIECHGFAGDGLHRPIFFDSQWEKYRGTLMWVDPAGEGADKTAYAIGSQLNGFVWTHEVAGLTGGYNADVLDTIARRAKHFRVRTIYVEKTWGMGMFVPLLQAALKTHFCIPGVDAACPDGWACDVVAQPVQGMGRKEQRIIRAAEGPIQNHRVIIDPAVARNAAFQFQLTHIHNEPKALQHDDEIEAFAMMLWCFREELDQNTTLASERARLAAQQARADADEAERQGRPWRKRIYRWFRH